MCSPHLVSLMVGRFYVSCCSGSFIQFCYLFQKEIKHTSTNLEPKVISCSSQHFTYYGRRVWLSVPKNSYFFPLGSNTPQFHGTQARPTREAKCPACLLCRIWQMSSNSSILQSCYISGSRTIEVAGQAFKIPISLRNKHVIFFSIFKARMS